MKKSVVVFLASIGIMLMLTSCDFPFLNGSKNLTKEQNPNLNKGEVSDQEIWLTDWKASSCTYNGCKATYTIQKGKPVPFLWCVFKGHEDKMGLAEALLAEEEHGIGYSYCGMLLKPNKKGITAMDLVDYPYSKVDWVGERIFTWKINILEADDYGYHVIKEVELSVKIIGVE